MFKVQENTDGSTSIFCRSSGKLICVIKGHRRPQSSTVDCCITCPIGVDETLSNCKSSVLNNGLGSDFKTDLKHLSEDVKTLHLDQNGQPLCLDHDIESVTKIQTKRSKCCISPIPVRLDNEPKEDYYDDCITQEEFARCLNLVPTEKFNENSIDKLKAEFPLRHLSRTAAFVRNDVLREVKLFDDMPLTSCLGGKILKLNPEKNFFNEQAISMAIKKYDSFCRFPVNTAKLVGGNFPKLRCREIKEYPVCIPMKVLKVESTHIYTFGKRQRLEKKITLRTGLDKRSRRLLNFCNRKKCVVQLRKLSKKKIVDWTARKPQPSSSLNICASYETSEPRNEIYSVDHSSEKVKPLNTEFSSDSNAVAPNHSLKFTSAARHSKLFPSSFVSPSSRFMKNCLYPHRYNVLHLGANDCRECIVKLCDIKKNIHKVCNEYYVKGTRIRIPFYSDYVNMLVSEKLFKINNFSDNRNQHSILKNDHAYHRPFIKEKTKTKLNYDSHLSSCNSSSKRDNSTTKRTKLNHSAQKTSISLMNSLKKSSSSVSSNAIRKINDAKPIPVVDLTDDSIINSPVKPSPVPVLSENLVVCKWMFHCFGCGHKCLFYDKSFTDTAVTEHMQIYHSVSEPDSFLTSYLDRVNKCAIIEAFPGYKSN